VRGKVDVVLRNKTNGQIYIIDWKTTKRLQPDESFRMSQQLPIYQYILEAYYNVQIDDAAVIQILSKPFVEVGINQNGSISRRAIKVSWGHYLAAIIEAGQDPDDYQDMKSRLEEHEFLRLSSVSTGSDTRQRFVENFIAAGVVIREEVYNVDSPPRKVGVRTMGYACRNCQYQQLCEAEMYGEDAMGIIEDYYIERR